MNEIKLRSAPATTPRPILRAVALCASTAARRGTGRAGSGWRRRRQVGRCSAQGELFGCRGGLGVWEPPHAESVEQPEEAREGRHEQGHLKRAVACLLVDA